jgi:hypothetical protein
MPAPNGDQGHKFLYIALGICHSADHRDHSHWNEQTTLCSVTLEGETLEIGNAFVRKLLRHTALYSGI